jgi:hypothetical protein
MVGIGEACSGIRSFQATVILAVAGFAKLVHK